jgi:DNA-binding SARP family transcriptional activator
VIELDPYREHAHRLVIAAHLQLDDVTGARQALDRLDAVLEEFDVTADGSTDILRRQVTSRLGG